MVLARPDEWETWLYHCSLRLFTMFRSSCGLIEAVGRSFGPAREGIRCSHPPRVFHLRLKKLVSAWHHWVDIFIARRKEPNGQRGSTMNSAATCSTWRGIGFVRLYAACDSPYDENKQPQDTTHLIQEPCYQRGGLCLDPAGNQMTQRPPDHYKEMQTEVVWTCLPLIRFG